MKTSIIIPVYNEEHTIAEVLERVKQLNILKEIIVVDDGSTDGTASILDRMQREGTVMVYHQEKNAGKGWAIRTGLHYVTGDIVIIQDADLELDPMDIPRVIQPIAKGKAQVVYGSRFHKRIRGMAPLRLLANKILSAVTSFLYKTRITDMETGYKAFKTDILSNLDLKSHGFEIEPELTAKVLRRGYQIHEVPMSYHPRTIYQGKKMKWTDGVIALFILFKYRFFK